MKALVLTEESISRLNRFGISEEWFEDFNLPGGNHSLKRSVVAEIVFLFEDGLNDDNVPLIVIKIDGDNGIFGVGRPNALILDRIILGSFAHFSNTVQIPTSWKCYSEGDILSYYAGTVHKGRGARLHAQKNPNRSRDILFFAWTERTVEFSSLPRDRDLQIFVREKLAEAILSASDDPFEDTTAGIVLCEKLPNGFTQQADLQQWYDSKLTREQRRFVDMSYNGPVRLRGTAGTGKTLSLVVKMLRDGMKFRSSSQKKRLCFVAHSQGAVDLVQSISESLLSSRIFRTFSAGDSIIQIRTLYGLAHEHLHFQLRDLTPVSLDGFEGRKFQFDLIVVALKEAWQSRITKARFRSIESSLRRRWMTVANDEEPAFVAELMNEFACVIDAEHIKRGEYEGEEYIKRGRRPKWLLSLPNEVDRRFVLEIHSIYKRHLAEMKALSIDEMVADFNLFLDSNSWDRERETVGFDAIFVDELHFFTAQEKQTLQKLVRRSSTNEGVPQRPNIFMAYDLKQSPRDSFLDYFVADGSIFSPRTGLQDSNLIELNRVFRYTPQIADFLKDLDAAFPAIDIPGEWNAYVGDSDLPDSGQPTLIRYTDNKQLLQKVFEWAKTLARKMNGGGRRVAVLCVSEEVFELYQLPVEGRYKGICYPIDSREATANMRHVGRKFVFSMPEYVAGLQFDTVFLIHVNQSEAPESVGIGRRRQLISNTYLGASRAENALFVCSSEERGGPSDILNLSIARGSLVSGLN